MEWLCVYKLSLKVYELSLKVHLKVYKLLGREVL